jgi:hypothetical protein
LTGLAHAPAASGFRAIPDTRYIFFAPYDKNKKVMSGIELASNGETISDITSSLTHFTHTNANVAIIDVRGFLQANKLRFLLVSYKEFDTSTLSNTSKARKARYRIYRDKAQKDPTTAEEPGKQCGTNYVDGCKECSTSDVNKCGTCKDNQGKKLPNNTF